MGRVIATYDTPSKSYIGYREGVPDVQASVTDAEVDARAEQEQRAAFEQGEDTKAERHLDYVRASFEGFSPPSHQVVRERLAAEILAERLPDTEEAATPRRRRAPAE